MHVYMIDFCPCWGTRWKDIDRVLTGPYSTKEKAEKVRLQIIYQMGFERDTAKVRVQRRPMDEAVSIVLPSLRKTIKIVP